MIRKPGVTPFSRRDIICADEVVRRRKHEKKISNHNRDFNICFIVHIHQGLPVVTSGSDAYKRAGTCVISRAVPGEHKG